MTARYFLPCRCGEKLTVRANQAGQQIRCRCGAAVEVPAMRALRELAQDVEQPTTKKNWGRRQGLIYVGLVVAAGGLLLAGYWYVTRPMFDYALLRRQVEAQSTADFYDMWRFYREFDTVAPLSEREILALAVPWEQTQRRIAAAAAVSLAGLLIAGGGLLLRPGKR